VKERAIALYKKVITSCDNALAIKLLDPKDPVGDTELPKSVKALYRKSIALEKLGEVDLGRKCVKEALVIEPENKEVLRQDKVLERLQLVQKKKEGKMAKKMFG